jgi:pimeloyl-ACP methyl ester carboxylesterase
MGGQIAMEFGRRFPARVAGIVLAATPFLIITESSPLPPWSSSRFASLR